MPSIFVFGGDKRGLKCRILSSSMAHRKAKQEAFELFKKGFFPQDTAASLKVNVRTVQRWFQGEHPNFANR
ncbi:MAG: hypothetical protein KME22_14190 [Hassallia sp. WJT32-NPBG1]|nr:hypothetical protein [Hassallia sp. WJT32-NPBG1]